MSWRTLASVAHVVGFLPCPYPHVYDVRLFNPDTRAEVVKRVDSYGTFYSLQAADEALKSELTLFQVL